MLFFSNYCRSNARLVGKTVVITGANCGIGKETARDLYSRGARVILACRDINKAEEAVNDIKEYSSRSTQDSEDEAGQLEICQLNLSSLTSIKKCAQRLLTNESTINILINNAGVFLHPFEKTEDGFETHFQVNYLGHFLLTLLLLPKIQKSAPDSKIINVSSLAHKFGDMYMEDLNLERSYSSLKAYCQSKLANILFTKELDKKLKTAGIHDVHVYSLHPGVVKTDLGRHIDATIFRGARLLLSMFHPFVKSIKQGAQTTIYCAVDENAAKESGLYYDNCRVVRSSQNTYNAELAKQLWKRSCEMLNLPSEAELGELLEAMSNKEVGL